MSSETGRMPKRPDQVTRRCEHFAFQKGEFEEFEMQIGFHEICLSGIEIILVDVNAPYALC